MSDITQNIIKSGKSGYLSSWKAFKIQPCLLSATHQFFIL